MENLLCTLVIGGLGNQLFIIATAIAYAKKHKKTVHCFFLTSASKDAARKNHFGLPPGIPKGLDIAVEYHEPAFSYTEIPYYAGNILMTGYFQSSKYFSREIIDTINIPKTPAYVFPAVPAGKVPVCVHIRRGDYIGRETYHCTQTPEYYSGAVTVMREKVNNPHFLIFSDDIDYITGAIVGDIADCEKTVVNMCDTDSINVMKACSHFIIANSSFSWWGAMLGGYEIVVAPKKWFGKDGPQDWHDVYEHDWILL